MKVALGADHAGCPVKDALASHLKEAGHEVDDLGTRDPAVPVDYPVYAEAVARAVTEGRAELGVLVCGTGIGMSIAANKVPGVRAALVHDTTTGSLARRHNDANVVCLPGRLLDAAAATAALDAFLGAAFEPRHQPRLDLIAGLERKSRR
jgi:ribose 5-phosphate isomerase B